MVNVMKGMLVLLVELSTLSLILALPFTSNGTFGDILPDPEPEPVQGTDHVDGLDTSHFGSRQKRQVYYTPEWQWTWKDGVVPYHITSSISSYTKKEFGYAVAEWESKTCLNFRPVTYEDLKFIKVKDGGVGCNSFIGKLHWPYDTYLERSQVMNLANSCSKPAILHEIGHAIGFTHTMARTDRDKYITVQTENIQAGWAYAFEINNYTVTKGIPYDYYSVMHYGAYTYSNMKGPTIITKDTAFQNKIGLTGYLSYYDSMLTNMIYNCTDHCDPNLKCESGFLDKGCSKCWCRSNFSGRPYYCSNAAVIVTGNITSE